MTLGRIMFDLQGSALTAQEREYLHHPLAGGVILFERNYESPAQLQALVAEIQALHEPPLLVAVDQEGGRVQRLRREFTTLPAPRELGRLYEESRRRAKRLAEACGWVMAAELRAVGIDLSFAPVLDLDRGASGVIGDRAFHGDPQIVADLAQSYVRGMGRAGMAATGKHFPGHGSVAADSHVDLPRDERPYVDIEQQDLLSFERMIRAGLPALMTAHVVYPQVDREPASFSRVWLQQIARSRLGFQGAIFSDDLSMGAARVAGGPLERAQAAVAAGCDMVLVCNDAAAVGTLLQRLEAPTDPVSQMRLMRMRGRRALTRTELQRDVRYLNACRMVGTMLA